MALWCLVLAPGAAARQMELIGEPGQWFLKSQSNKVLLENMWVKDTTLLILQSNLSRAWSLWLLWWPWLAKTQVHHQQGHPLSPEFHVLSLSRPDHAVLLTLPLLSSSATMTVLLLPAVKTFPPAWSSCQAFPFWDVAESSRGQLLWHITGNLTR